MTAHIDDDDILPDDVAMHGRTYAHRWQQDRLNRDSYLTWKHVLHSVALSSFEWEGVPELIDPRYIEVCLLNYGMGGFFDMSPGAGMWAFTQAVPLGNINMYYNPNAIQLTPPNGQTSWIRNAYWHIKTLFDKSMTIEAPDAIVCYDNIRRVSLIPILDQYARRLARIDRIIDQNIGVQATPYVITTPEESKKDAYNLLKQLTGFEPAIIRYDTKASVATPDVLKLDAPYVSDKLLADQAKILDQVMTLLGIDNTNTEKRERMIEGEASSNDERILLMRRSRIESRKRFVDQVRKITGGEVDMDVHYAMVHNDQGRPDMSIYDADDTRSVLVDDANPDNDREIEQ